jgi:hypothetical protein
MDCQEIRGNLRATAASYSARRLQSAQLLPRLNHTLPFSNRRSITPSPGSCWGSSGRGKQHRPARCADGSPSLKIPPNQTALKIQKLM